MLGDKPKITATNLLQSSLAIIPDKLHFHVGKYQPHETEQWVDDKKVVCFSTDKDYKYVGYFLDTGPLCLADLYRYFRQLQKLIDDNPDFVICHCSGSDRAARTNAAFLIGSYCIYVLAAEPRSIYDKLVNCSKGHAFLHFKDASNSSDSKRLSLLSTLKAVGEAKRVALMPTIDSFNIQEYDHYFKVENGDISWIVPEKIIAFAGPYNKSFTSTKMYAHPPEKYVPIFKQWNVSAVIRLNSPKTYPKQVFIDAGIKHYDMVFRDGSSPTNEIVSKFLKICHDEQGAVAIHCKAGLGRTGTLICAYLIWKYKIRAPPAIAWCRICRPGSVIGLQQNHLANIQNWLLKADVARPPSPPIPRSPSPSTGESSKQRAKAVQKNAEETAGQPHQAEMLNLAKLARSKLNIS